MTLGIIYYNLEKLKQVHSFINNQQFLCTSMKYHLHCYPYLKSTVKDAILLFGIYCTIKS